MSTVDQIKHYIEQPLCTCDTCVQVMQEEDADFVTWWAVTPDNLINGFELYAGGR